jgi:hypothetical protein
MSTEEVKEASEESELDWSALKREFSSVVGMAARERRRWTAEVGDGKRKRWRRGDQPELSDTM